MRVLQPSNITFDQAGIRTSVIDCIPAFLKTCLGPEYDVIVPIESEGLALFLSKTTELQASRLDDIVPSTTLERIDTYSLVGKRVLVVDVSVNSGQTLLNTVKLIHDRFNVIPALAALFVNRDYEHLSKLDFIGVAPLSPNQYDWARESLIQFLLEHVFVRAGDPPMWEVNFEEATRQSLLLTLMDMGATYGLPGTAGSWTRITIDDIQLTETTWVPKPDDVRVSGTHKIRILMHSSEGKMRILPLFFPQTRKDLSLDPKEDLSSINKPFDDGLKVPTELLRTMLEDKSLPFAEFRLLSSLGSILLLKDFALRLMNEGINCAWNDVSAPRVVTELYRVLGRENHLNMLQSLARSVFKTDRSEKQLLLPIYHFTFQRIKPATFGTFVPTGKYEGLSLEEVLGCVFGRATLNTPTESSAHTFEAALSFEEIVHRIPEINQYGVSRAIDTLIDEGILKPTISYKGGFATRTFVVAGESVKKRLRAYGLAFQALEKRNNEQ